MLELLAGARLRIKCCLVVSTGLAGIRLSVHSLQNIQVNMVYFKLVSRAYFADIGLLLGFTNYV